MTRELFYKFVEQNDGSDLYALDMDYRPHIPGLVGCLKKKSSWIVYENNYRGRVSRRTRFRSEEEALDYMALLLGITISPRGRHVGEMLEVMYAVEEGMKSARRKFRPRILPRIPILPPSIIFSARKRGKNSGAKRHA